MRIRILLVLTVFLCASVMSSRGQSQSGYLYVAPGLGIEGISVGYSTKSSVAAKYGDGYELIEHNKYSYEMRYVTKDISFWYRHGDPQQTIFALSVRPDSRAFTSRGIVVGSSTLKDVFKAYGKSEIRTTTAHETWHVEYPGIIFNVEYRKSDSGKDWTDEKLMKRKIIEIEIVAFEAEAGSAREKKAQVAVARYRPDRDRIYRWLRRRAAS